MSLLLLFLFTGASPQESERTLDVQQIGKIHDSLKAYFSEWQTARVKWIRRPVDSSKFHPEGQKRKEALFRARAEKYNDLPADERSEHLKQLARDKDESRDVYTDCDFLWSTSGYCERNKEKLLGFDGTMKIRRYEKYFSNGRTIFLDRDFKSADFNTKNPAKTHGYTPADSLGLRVPFTDQRRLCDFFGDTAQPIKVLGEEVVRENKVVALQIGPDFTTNSRPAGWKDDSYLKLWLCSEKSFLPARIEVHYRSESGPIVEKGIDGKPIRFFVNRFEHWDFRPIPNHRNNSKLFFPFKTVAGTESANQMEHNVIEAELNPPLKEESFEPRIPSDYKIRFDGKEKGAEIKPLGGLQPSWNEHSFGC